MQNIECKHPVRGFHRKSQLTCRLGLRHRFTQNTDELGSEPERFRAAPGIECLASNAEPIEEFARMKTCCSFQGGRIFLSGKTAELQHIDLERCGIDDDVIA